MKFLYKLMGKYQGGVSCHEVGKSLQHFLDHEVDDLTAKKLKIHLEECRRCGLKAKTFQSIKGALSDLGEPIPSDLESQLRAFSNELLANDSDQ